MTEYTASGMRGRTDISFTTVFKAGKPNHDSRGRAIRLMTGLLLGGSLLVSGCARNDGGAPIYWGTNRTQQDGTPIVTGSTQRGLQPGEVRVQQGDTVYGLARGYGVEPHAIVEMNRLVPPYDLVPGQIVRIPPSQTPSALNTGVAANTVQGGTYRAGRAVSVRAGDTLYGLARQHGTTPQALAAANNLQAPYTLRLGQSLTLPGGGASAGASVQRTGSSYVTANQIQVRDGDTLYSVARQYNISPMALASANQLRVPYNLQPGQTLVVPGQASSNVTSSVSSAARPTVSSPVATSSVNRAASYAHPRGAVQTVTVQKGDTVHSIARHYGLSVKEVAHHNRLQPPYIVRPGQQIAIPSPGGSAVPSRHSAVPVQARSEASYTVRRGDTLYSIARAHGVSVRDLQSLNGLSDASQLSAGQNLRIRPDLGVKNKTPSAPAQTVAQAEKPVVLTPSAQHSAPAQTTAVASKVTSTAAPAIRRADGTQMGGPTVDIVSLDDDDAAPKVLNAPTSTLPSSASVAGAGAASTQTVAQAKSAQTSSQPAAPQNTTPATTPIKTAALTGFIMPVQGRILSGYGPKSNGLHNDGLNIAVKEGTPVRAAQAGTVTYAGQELKGYGKLLLIKHDDGFVTAYAHNSRLLVRQGDKVRQGDVVAESGATGYVDSPQLHFEIRKGRKSVDPAQFFKDLS